MCEQFKGGGKSDHVVVVRLACVPPKGGFDGTKVSKQKCVCTCM